MSDDSFRARVTELMRSPRYQPLTKSGLARELGLSPEERATFRHVLREMEEDGTVICGKKALYTLRTKSPGAMTGVIKFLNSGGAHFLPDANDADNLVQLRQLGVDMSREVRLWVPESATETALPGDYVTAKASPGRGERNDVEARVVRVLERNRRPFVGSLVRRGREWGVAPDDPGLPVMFDLAPTDHELTAGHKILAVCDEWESRARRPVARFLKDLGSPDTPGLAVLAIIHKFDLPTEFPDDVVREVDKIPAGIPAEEIAVREDWREREVITIDPTDARDFDDAISVETLKGGGWELAVHIADVAYYVRPGTALDREAVHRGNSVYLADRVIPMLPEKLSNGLCSLQPGVERLTRVAVMQFDAKGRRTHARFGRAVIRSQRRFTYEEAYEEMKAKDPGLRSAVLDRAWPLASLLRRKRFEKGSLDLDFPEVRAVLDEKGRPTGLKVTANDESHQLIEEFMLAANEAVAETIKNSNTPGIYRSHEDPDEEKLADFAFKAALSGIQAGNLTHRPELQRVLEAIKGRPDEHALKIALLKSLKRAIYSPDPLGHFGLAKENYTHFTSPIRRYADLVVHRVLGNMLYRAGSAAEERSRTPTRAAMVEIAEHLSLTERNAAEAEQESQRLMQCVYFDGLLRRKPRPQFEAVIVEARRMGVFVELRQFPIRGLVKVSDFPEGDFMFDHGAERFYSRAPRYNFRPGTLVTVVPERVDHDRRLIDFRIVAVQPEKHTAPARKTHAAKKTARGEGRGDTEDARRRKRVTRSKRR